MKKAISLLLAALMIYTILPPQRALGVSVVPEISAKSCIVLDAETGTVMYEKDADLLMGIASTTKILTALVVLESCDPEEIVEIKKEWTGIEGSSMYLKAGEQLSVKTLLYGMMMRSGNDAAHALACHAAGSIEAFADMMNERARSLGCTQSYFENPHGLDGERHFATARELAIITMEAMKNDVFTEIVSTKNIKIGERSMENHNKLLWQYDGVLGVKTGYTISAGRSLASCAERDDTRIICVTLDDRDDWVDHANLYDWAFTSFEPFEIAKGEIIDAVLPVISGVKASVSLMTGEGVSIKLPRGCDYSLTVEAPKFVYAVVVRGGIAGQLVVRLNGKLMAAVPLIFTETIRQAETEKLTTWEQIKRSWYKANEYSGYQGFGYY